MSTNGCTQQEMLDYFKSVLGPERVLTDRENLERAASDHTEDFVFLPEMVLQPRTTEEVSKILAYCNQHPQRRWYRFEWWQPPYIGQCCAGYAPYEHHSGY